MRTLIRSAAALAATLILGTMTQEVLAQAVAPGEVLISEFRLEGPGGFADEYVELYCNRQTDCDISEFNLVAFAPGFGDFAVTLPADLVIPARGHLLIVDDAGYTLGDYAGPDLIASLGGTDDFFVDNEGLQLRNADMSVVIDSVGFVGGGGEVAYVEGTGLQRASAARPDDQYAYVRQMTRASVGRPQDTNNNAADFVLVSVTGAAHPGIAAQPVLGAPGPQNGVAALVRNGIVAASLVEPAVSTSLPPNFVRIGIGNSGTLSLRRSFTNNTGQSISSLRFRVVEVTTLNSPGYAAGNGQADLRLVTSADAETFINTRGRVVVVRGTRLEFDAGTEEPAQPNGGGLNSSVSFTDAPIAAGETVDVQFLLNVAQAGAFSFFVNVEATTTAPAAGPGVPLKLSGSVPRLTKRKRFAEPNAARPQRARRKAGR